MTDALDIKRAEILCKLWHGSQKRKYSGKPYWTHPFAVANIIAGCSTKHGDLLNEMIITALLHDVVEDTDATFFEVEAFFGPMISHLVENVTDVSKPHDGNRAARIAIDVEHLKKADWRAQTVKCADIIHNVRDIAKYDPGFARKYIKEKQLAVDVLVDAEEPLKLLAQRALDDARELLNE